MGNCVNRRSAMTSNAYRWKIVWLLALVSMHAASALVVDRPCCHRMIHVSGEFADKMAIKETPVAEKELVPVTPFHGCEPVTSHVDLRGRIALVQRGECNFVKKVWHAQRAGAAGVVVMDAAARSEPPYHIIMQRDENASQIEVPAVFVSYDDGERLLRLLDQAPPWSPVLVTISNIGELPHDKTQYRLIKRAIAYIFLVSAVCALSSGLSIVSSFVFNFIGKTWRTRVTKRLPTLSYRPRLQQELLDHAIRDANVLDRIVLDDTDDPSGADLATAIQDDMRGDDSMPAGDAEICSICLEEFAAAEQVKVLPCQHFFHVECIDPWLEKRSGFCPLCKQDAIATMDDAPKSIFGYTLPRLDQVLRQEHWFHTFFLMLPASLVSCLIVNSAASFIRNMWP